MYGLKNIAKFFTDVVRLLDNIYYSLYRIEGILKNTDYSQISIPEHVKNKVTDKIPEPVKEDKQYIIDYSDLSIINKAMNLDDFYNRIRYAVLKSNAPLLYIPSKDEDEFKLKEVDEVSPMNKHIYFKAERTELDEIKVTYFRVVFDFDTKVPTVLYSIVVKL
jgi:hypothetical protein